jgi:hypothetical protein
MFPISDDTLTFSEIADYWSREIKPKASVFELLRVLEKAWWNGEIVGETALSRLKLLRHLFQSSHDFGIVFVLGDEPGPSEIKEPTDGNVDFDLRPRVKVPATDTVTWNDTNCALAYQALASWSSLTSDPVIGPALRGIHQDFIQLLLRHRHNLPTFWATSETDSDTPRSTDQSPSNMLVGGARRRGPKPKKLRRVKAAMRDDIQQQRRSVADLQDMPEKTLAETYGASRDTVRKARTAIVFEFVGNPIIDN